MSEREGKWRGKGGFDEWSEWVWRVGKSRLWDGVLGLEHAVLLKGPRKMFVSSQLSMEGCARCAPYARIMPISIFYQRSSAGSCARACSLRFKIQILCFMPTLELADLCSSVSPFALQLHFFCIIQMWHLLCEFMHCIDHYYL